MEKTMYGISKLAREISEYLDTAMIIVWDILEELNYQSQELTGKQVMQWTTRVEKKLYETRKSLHIM